MSVEMVLFLSLCGIGLLYEILVNTEKGKSFGDTMRDVYHDFFPQ